MASGQAQTTAAGNFKRPDIGTVLQWVKTAWGMIDGPTVKYSFMKTGISNALNGTEDDILWNDPSTSTPTEDNSEDDSDTDDVYQDMITEEQARALSEETDDEEFEGFWT